MLKINKKVEYALMSLKAMAERKAHELTSVRELVDQFQIPFDTTAKVLQILNNNGVVKSVQGVKGGYVLNQSLNKITYRQLEAMIEGQTSNVNCLNGHCDQMNNCNIIDPIKRLEVKLNNYLDSLTLADFLLADEQHLRPELKKEDMSS